jgi:uncharacterized protein (UPF0332 family)
VNEAAAHLWDRAKDALRVAKHNLPVSADAAASSAYYAAFYAVSALFELQGRTFHKHTAVEAAVHRDLVREGLWPAALGRAFSDLEEMREVGHYGGVKHVAPEEAARAIQMADDILRAVAKLRPQEFTGLDDV